MILCLADDLTGLTELACLAVQRGFRGEMHADFAERTVLTPPGPKALIFENLSCRTVTGPAAYERVRGCLRQYPAKVEHIYLKIDSAARGPIGWMLQALLDSSPRHPLPVMLANPETQRHTHDGIHWVGERPLHLSPFAEDPLHPVRCSDLRVQLATGLKTPLLLERDLPADAQDSVVIIDGESQADVQRAAARFASHSAAAGAAAFGLELLQHWRAAAGYSMPGSSIPARQFLAISGSAHTATESLARDLVALGGRTHRCDEPLTPLELPLLLLPPQARLEPQQAAAALLQRGLEAIETLRPNVIFLVGGETAQAYLRELKIGALQPLDYPGRVARLAIQDERRFPREVWLQPGSYYSAGTLAGLIRTE